MKTAISIPDELFLAGERAAERMGVSRSELYRRALRNFLADHGDRSVTEALDAVHAERKEDSAVDPHLAALQAASLEGDEW